MRPPPHGHRPEQPDRRDSRSRPPERVVEGKLQHKGTFAFLLAEKPGQPDLYIGGPSVRLAMDGDRVQARLAGQRAGRDQWEIVRIVSRARATMVGMLRQAGRFWAVVPEGALEDAAVEVLGFAKGVKPEKGKLVTLRFDRWPTPERVAGGTVTEVLGDPNDSAVRRAAVLAERGIPTEFSDRTLEEAEALPLDPPEEAFEGRKVLFDLPIVTIDGADAKDFDDAVSLEPLDGGRWRLGVHIASVSDYVRPGTALDADAVTRGTSVYLPGRVIPMLPPKLSDHLCSLRPDVPRLTLTCWLELSTDGQPGRVDLEETVIRSWRRFTYEEVQDVIDGKDVERVVPAVRKMVLDMGAVAERLTSARMSRGALDMAVPEYYIRVDAKGEPIAVDRRPRLASHRLIEEFMVAANEAVARTLTKARAPFLRRVHDDPDPAKLAELQDELGRLGIRASTDVVAHPVEGLQSLLRAAEGHPLRETANTMVIRSMKLARYSAEPGGHFGLASKDYCHFTSPIRRYPDLQVHRAVRAMLRGKARAAGEGVDLEALAARCSERERAATEAERKSVDLCRAALLGREVGRVFEAVVTGVGPMGVFLTDPQTGATGLWRSGHAQMGQRLSVKLTSVDEALGRLELEPAKTGLPGGVRVSPWRAPGRPPRRDDRDRRDDRGRRDRRGRR